MQLDFELIQKTEQFEGNKGSIALCSRSLKTLSSIDRILLVKSLRQ